jgi:hypothetical protein
MYKSTTKCNETIGKWCKNKHGASKIIDTFETYHFCRQPYPQNPVKPVSHLPTPLPLAFHDRSHHPAQHGVLSALPPLLRARPEFATTAFHASTNHLHSTTTPRSAAHHSMSANLHSDSNKVIGTPRSRRHTPSPATGSR